MASYFSAKNVYKVYKNAIKVSIKEELLKQLRAPFFLKIL